MWLKFYHREYEWQIIVCGLNHKTAPISLREKIVFSKEKQAKVYADLLALDGINEVVVYSTCNRTEIVIDAKSIDSVIDWMLLEFQVNADDLRACLYQYESTSAITHLLRVATGLDSMVLGEPQVFGQVKSAFAVACEVGAVGTQLDRLFQRVFSVVKRVRTTTTVGACPVSLASIAVKLTKQLRQNIVDGKVLVLGSGETSQTVIKHLVEDGITSVTVAGRHYLKVHNVTRQFAITGILLEDVVKAIPQYDVIISATSSSLPLVSCDLLQRAFTGMDKKPLLIIDLAIPRDVEPEVSNLDFVDLYNVDDLRDTIQQNIRVREHAAAKAEELISVEAKEFETWLASLGAVDTVKAYRAHIEALRDSEIQKALDAYSRGSDPESVIESLANSLSNKFMHKPSVKLREASSNGRHEILKLTQELFDID